MRYIIEKVNGGFCISEGVPKRDNKPNQSTDRCVSSFSYKVVYQSMPPDRSVWTGRQLRGYVGNCYAIDKSDIVKVTKHYKNFEEFMADHLELFL